ncbi:unnamed protein product [Amoebophrya sp. A25]|nr:unnamed protein product [Amoebophrya sp. A25]|eukprot:GSA25T00014759001.1
MPADSIAPPSFISVGNARGNASACSVHCTPDEMVGKEGYALPHLNKRIVLNHKGFQEPPAELDRYINLGHLDLSFNGMARIRNLGRLSHLVSLQLQSNTLTRIEGLEYNLKLQQLNLSYNQIRVLELGTLRHLTQLRNLNLSHNQLSCFPTEAQLEGRLGEAVSTGGGNALDSILEEEEEELEVLASAEEKITPGATRYNITSNDDDLDDDNKNDVNLDKDDDKAEGDHSSSGGGEDSNTDSISNMRGDTSGGGGLSGNTRSTSATSLAAGRRTRTAVAADMAKELLSLPSLTNLDISWNQFADFSVPDATNFFKKFKTLEVLYFHRNPGLRHLTNYRRHMLVELPKLKYLDEAPVFSREREFARAYIEDGGAEGERKAREKYKQSLKDAKPTEDWEERKHWVSKQRELALARIRKEEDKKNERHAQYYEYLKRQEQREQHFRETVQNEWDSFRPLTEEEVRDGSDGAGASGGSTKTSQTSKGQIDAEESEQCADAEELRRRATYSCLDAPSLNPEVGERDDFESRVTQYLIENPVGKEEEQVAEKVVASSSTTTSTYSSTIPSTKTNNMISCSMLIREEDEDSRRGSDENGQKAFSSGAPDAKVSASDGAQKFLPPDRRKTIEDVPGVYIGPKTGTNTAETTSTKTLKMNELDELD